MLKIPYMYLAWYTLKTLIQANAIKFIHSKVCTTYTT